MTTKHHWFPFYHDAWVIGTLDLSFQQQGIYLRLLLMQFNDGYVDLNKFLKMYRCLTEQERVDLNLVLKHFFQRCDNFGDAFRNLRLQEVMDEQLSKSERRTRQTAAARASKQKKAKAATEPVTEPVTESVTKRELELELELEPEKEKELSAPALASDEYAIEDAVQSWNEAAKPHANLATVRAITDKRRRAWRIASSKPGFLASWKAGLKKIPVHNHGSFAWQPTFDWTLNEANITKLIEGNYDAPQANDRKARVSKFING